MKKLFLITAITILALTASAQSKKLKGSGYTVKPFKLLDSTITSTSTFALQGYNSFSAETWRQPSYSFMKFNNGDYIHILSVSSPDSTGKITVTFSRSLVHFINDSTFTYKQK